MRCGVGDAAGRVQVVGGQRAHQVRLCALPERCQDGEPPGDFRLALVDQLPAGTGELHFLAREPPPSGPDLPGCLLGSMDGEVRPPHV